MNWIEKRDNCKSQSTIKKITKDVAGMKLAGSSIIDIVE